MNVEELNKKYGLPSGSAPTSKPTAGSLFRQKVNALRSQQQYESSPVTHSNRLAAAKSDAAKSAQEEKDVNSFTGQAKEFGKAFVKNVASAEVGLGESLRKIYGNQSDTYTKEIENTTATMQSLSKQIRDRKLAGKDTTKLNNIYKDLDIQLKELQGGLKEEEAPTTGEVAGQLGGTALDILTAGTYGKAAQGLKSGTIVGKFGAPSAVKIATETPGLFTKGGVKAIGKGAGVGYLYDVAAGVRGDRGEDRTGAASLIPGAGTVAGATIPAVFGLAKSTQNRFSGGYKERIAISKKEKALNQIESANASIRKTVKKYAEKGVDVKKTLAESDLLLNSVDENGIMRTQNAIDEMDDFIKPQEAVISDNLRKEGVKIPIKTVEKQLKAAINNSNIKGGAKIRALQNAADEIKGLKLDAKGNMIDLGTIHDAKITKYANVNYMNPESKTVDKLIAKTLKEIVEENTKTVNVGELNKELQHSYAVMKMLQELDGKRVLGGRLGKYFAQTVGGVAGSHFGPLGTLVGAEVAGRVQGKMMQAPFAGKTGKMPQMSQQMQEAIAKGGGKDKLVNLAQKQTLGPLNQKIAEGETYTQQGVRELGEIGGKVKDFIKNPKLGMSIQDVSKKAGAIDDIIQSKLNVKNHADFLDFRKELNKFLSDPVKLTKKVGDTVSNQEKFVGMFGGNDLSSQANRSLKEMGWILRDSPDLIKLIPDEQADLVLEFMNQNQNDIYPMLKKLYADKGSVISSLKPVNYISGHLQKMKDMMADPDVAAMMTPEQTKSMLSGLKKDIVDGLKVGGEVDIAQKIDDILNIADITTLDELQNIIANILKKL